MKVSEFEFPASVSSTAVPNDVVFCGKVITRRTEPGSAPQTEENRVLLRSKSWGRMTENRWRRSESCRKRYNGMFGTVKFPLQMELSDIKMRQDRRELPPLPPQNFTAKGDGDDAGDSCWELVRPLRRGGMLKNTILGCFFPIV